VILVTPSELAAGAYELEVRGRVYGSKHLRSGSLEKTLTVV
jgi:hypothetical protein